MTEIIEFEGRKFVQSDLYASDDWSCAIDNEHPVPTLTLKNDDIFLITDTLGNVASSRCSTNGVINSMGLFCKDTRYLSRLDLQINRQAPILLSSTAQKGFSLTVLAANPQINNPDSEEPILAETIGFEREIIIEGGLFEEIKITNFNTFAVEFTLSITFDADFLDIFDVRGYSREKRGNKLQFLEYYLGKIYHPEPEIILAYQGLDGIITESRIQFNNYLPDKIQGNTAIWTVQLEARENKVLGYHVQFFSDNKSASNIDDSTTLRQAKAAELMEAHHWREQATKIQTDDQEINEIIQQAEQDIYLLRQSIEGRYVLAAGVPWFSTLFGRDSIIAATQTLSLDPCLARDTLYVLAQYQGKTDNDWRDEELGKIMHEIRYGEMARCQEIPHTPYYGTIDATPLWLMLYAEYFAWTADEQTLEDLWDNALAAMDWCDRRLKDTGYIHYYCRSQRGLVNQGWKDSGNCIVDRKGKLAEGAIALSEVQGYVYAAKIRLAEIAYRKKLYDLADRWRKEAKELKIRFNHDFWLIDQGYFAVALDGKGKPVDSITSNPGHCLNTGIVDIEKAPSLAERLQAPDMFNGWGIRTLSSLNPTYNPMGYHIGAVWPHDNGMIATGLRSLGFVEQALEIAQGLFDMTLAQPYHRPPELFCGYERFDSNSPVKYPVACSPQAWASGSIFQLILMMLNLVPDAPGNYLRIIDPTLLPSIHWLSIQNLRVGKTLLDLEFERSNGTTACRVAKKRGNLRVVIEA
ncbi:amylo-alpha-1,6-glucosidase [Aphanothece hegewaldii CCALA 016]|uniref:Amylo-alpha-1,6-glucosidase n=1 Tax=Aphanothece hegewaldii CCALA 016 TaxID=2107694 RepID=A0A2T1LXD8_9CHRO|nr:amylo-alpha-1,6-glucosidase [Aphanothece hegewaldii]PSF36835.1 amylo-alpha-1,6-glucosidase [Aphanothece hegewaldii CCALA 016]